MSNYQYEDFDTKQFMTSIIWVLFIIHAKILRKTDTSVATEAAGPRKD